MRAAPGPFSGTRWSIAREFDASRRSRPQPPDRTAAETPPCFPAPDGRFKIPAAWLIERAGFAKGYGTGRVGVSHRHTLALVNRGGATAAELLALAQEIQTRVRAVFGVDLAPEPVFVGFWNEGPRRFRIIRVLR